MRWTASWTAKLRGTLSFKWLPESVKKLDLFDHAISIMKPKGLVEKGLTTLWLGNNQISTLNLEDFKGTLVDQLGLRCNRMDRLDLTGLSDTLITELWLYKNDITQITVGPQWNLTTHFKLLNVANNPLPRPVQQSKVHRKRKLSPQGFHDHLQRIFAVEQQGDHA